MLAQREEATAAHSCSCNICCNSSLFIVHTSTLFLGVFLQEDCEVIFFSQGMNGASLWYKLPKIIVGMLTFSRVKLSWPIWKTYLSTNSLFDCGYTIQYNTIQKRSGAEYCVNPCGKITEIGLSNTMLHIVTQEYPQNLFCAEENAHCAHAI